MHANLTAGCVNAVAMRNKLKKQMAFGGIAGYTYIPDIEITEQEYINLKNWLQSIYPELSSGAVYPEAEKVLPAAGSPGL